MKPKPKTRIKRSKRVIFKEVEGIVYILDPRSSTIHTLNETASFIWQHLNTPCSVKELTTLMTENFDVEEKKAAVDIKDFTLRYLKEKLVVLG